MLWGVVRLLSGARGDYLEGACGQVGATRHFLAMAMPHEALGMMDMDGIVDEDEAMTPSLGGGARARTVAASAKKKQRRGQAASEAPSPPSVAPTDGSEAGEMNGCDCPCDGLLCHGCNLAIEEEHKFITTGSSGATVWHSGCSSSV